MKIKKYLGQNFLKNKNFAHKIIEAAVVKKNDIILEVGPGKGFLTEELVKKAGSVIAVEKDNNLTDFLTDKFKGQKNLRIVHDDILKFVPKNYGLKAKAYKVVANIPYYITSHFLRKFLESDCQPSLMALMVQKEVAERIVARDKKESLLSISVKAYGKPKIIASVPAGNFFPKPKVDSAIILISDISKDFFGKKDIIDEKKFFEFLRFGFRHKRKLLKNNLSSFFALAKPSVRSSASDISYKIFKKCEIPALTRPEELTLENWRCLFAALP